MIELDFEDRKSKVIVCSDFEIIHTHIEQNINSKNLKKFYFDTIKVEDVRGIIKESYIKESDYKYIAISSSSYSVVVQNALLKVLEEPPSGVVFLILAKSKSSLLATVRSRLITHTIQIAKEPISLELNLKNLNLKDIFEFIKSHERSSKEELCDIIEQIIKLSTTKYEINFTQKEFELFDTLYKLTNLNTRASTVLSTLLLAIYDRTNK